MQKKKKLNKSKHLANSEQAQNLEIQYSLALVAGGLVCRGTARVQEFLSELTTHSFHE